ncbi:hypothetical protein KIF24_10150 [Micromonospora sp. Llam7]|uniref:hypothetical protein n=1 Tax=Micromonospora tarapacensis TaxID=2835305 RepID=UPI001C83A601|nr:hypothetical protein [Micromonospora tarapacensis]MBX7266352.1 hypothetical protein [Micromonospora tarapacensis]
MTMPLDVGIGHLSMCLSFDERNDPALQLINELTPRLPCQVRSLRRWTGITVGKDSQDMVFAW